MEIKNLSKVADRILGAIKNQEKIVLCGDSDLDGVSSVIILKESIKSLGGDIAAIYFPDREKDGYGITDKALDYLKDFKPALLVALDCGIGNFKEVKRAKEIGLEVIIIDHHQVLDQLPEADIIVDPQQPSDKYPFKELATGGIAFKLSELLLKEKMSKEMRKGLLELAALATIADKMPQVDENKVFVEEGLNNIETSWRPGLKVLLEDKSLKDHKIKERVFKVISMLNVRDVENGMPTSFLVLSTFSLQNLERMIKKLKKKNDLRKKRLEQILQDIEGRIILSKEPLIFEGDADWEYPLISAIASIVCREFEKPTFLYKRLKEESQGTVRIYSGRDSVALMKRCKQYLMTYGGHAQASGFRIKNENLDKFKACLIKNLK